MIERKERAISAHCGSSRNINGLDPSGTPLNPTDTIASVTHTPGPWTVGDRDGQAIVCGPATETLAAIPYAPCEGYGLTNVFEAMANARLIAAAPELLTAIQHVRSIIKDAALTGFNCHDGDWAERLFASQAMTFDAVKKATGAPDV